MNVARESAPPPRLPRYDYAPVYAGDFARIVDAVGEYFRVPVVRIMGPERPAPVVLARHFAVYEVRAHLGWSYPELARAFNRLDHTSMIYACRRVNAFLVDGDRKALDAAIALRRVLGDPPPPPAEDW